MLIGKVLVGHIICPFIFLPVECAYIHDIYAYVNCFNSVTHNNYNNSTHDNTFNDPSANYFNHAQGYIKYSSNCNMILYDLNKEERY